MSTIAVIGTGLLGTGFVQNLIRLGYSVRVWNRTAAKAEALMALGAVACATPAEAVTGADRVHLVLKDDSAVDPVLEAMREGLSSGVVVVDHSTNHPERVAERAERLGALGLRYLHAPVFMNPRNAAEASGLMLVAGTTAMVEELRPALEAMTGSLWHVGEEPGRAALLKLAGNGMLIGLVGLMGDLYAMADAQGVPPAAIDELLKRFNPASMLGYIGKRTAMGGASPASFELAMARKDVRLMVESAAGPEGLVVLPAVGAAMDDAIAEGRGTADYTVFGWRRRYQGSEG